MARLLLLLAFWLLPLWGSCHVVMKRSSHPFYKTLVRLVYAIKMHHLTTYAIIDYKKNAAKIGKKSFSAVAILISDPKLESELIAKNPKIGLDLPLKLYIYQKRNGVFITYHSPLELKEQYYIPSTTIHRLERLLKAISDYAIH